MKRDCFHSAFLRVTSLLKGSIPRSYRDTGMTISAPSTKDKDVLLVSGTRSVGDNIGEDVQY